MAKSWTGWFEIAVADFDRAKKFYETIFNMEIHTIDLGALKMGIFPHGKEGAGASICWGAWYKPSPHGTVVYLNAEPDLLEVQNKIEGAGGKIVQPKKQISPEHGFMALFEDTEGNRLALHSDA
ncbi:MAG: VOC family protein [Lewinellaceae bacterium]|nr:VOC family protein [Saprospiraceae bacterium]MCB9338597.1 VOC family protein [Lewinellaceae bacterium]